MITKQKALFFYVGDRPFKTLAEAQKHDLLETLMPLELTDEQDNKIADWMMANAAAITDVLTTTPTSRAKARKTNGATKAKKPKLQPTNINKEVLVAK